MKISTVIAIVLAVIAVLAGRWGFGRFMSKATDEYSSPIGTVSFDEKRVVVSDPGYSRATALRDSNALVIKGVRSGVWNANLVERKFRNLSRWIPCELVCTHSDVEASSSSLGWIEHEDWIGVDTGMAGVFLNSAFANSLFVPADVVFPESWAALSGDEHRWAGYCSYVMQHKNAAVVPKSGFVSQAGYGDGSYPVHLAKDSEGRVVGIRIVFIDEYGEG